MGLNQPSKFDVFADRMRAVFRDHKTEMLTAAAIGVLVGAVFF